MQGRDRENWAADLALARAAVAGDPGSVDEFIRRMDCVPHFLALSNYQVGSPLSRDEVEDSVQDAVTAIWSKLAEYSGAASLETWAYSFCSRTLMSAVRTKRKGRQRETLVPDPPAGATVQSDGDAQDPRELIYLHLHRLEQQQYLIVRLRIFEELTFTDIAARLGIAISTVKSQYAQALETLRAFLRPHMGDEWGTGPLEPTS